MGLGTVLKRHVFLVLLLTLWKWLLLLFGWSRKPAGLHTARFATNQEVASLTTKTLPEQGLLLGTNRQHQLLAVQPTPTRKELGNLLIVGPTRSGKGLLAISQLLSWRHSVIVNDIKGELFSATAGYRSTLGPVFVIDPTGVGHRYDPLAARQTEDELLSAAASLLITPEEGEGLIFTQRAVAMLTQLFIAARQEYAAPLPYVRHLTDLGFADAVAWVQSVNPTLATRLLDSQFARADLTNRFVLSAWSTLSARLLPLLTTTMVRCFTGSDFSAADLLRSEAPMTVYLRWRERDLLAQAPLVRLLWDSLIGELITTYDQVEGRGCHPVLLLLDEVGRTAMPALAEHATTVVGRGVSLWIAIQSLAQLEAVYGKARAQTLRDNMDSQLSYRPTDLTTATYLEQRLGSASAYAHSYTLKDGEEIGEGRVERPIPLLSAQQILQLPDEEILAFHRKLPPLRLTRMDWREHPDLTKRRSLAPPQLPTLPPVPDFTLPKRKGSKRRSFLDLESSN